MKKILIIMKKELVRFFTDKRMIVSLLLPAILLYVIYSIMGDITSKQMEKVNQSNYIVYIDNPQKELNFIEENADGFNITIINNNLSLDEVKQKIINKEIDLYVGYPADFYNQIINNNFVEKAPLVTIYYNSTKNQSVNIYNYYLTSLNNFESSLNNKFDISSNSDLSSKEERNSVLIVSMLPFLIVVLLFTGCMPIAVESIAGEKERGTISTLLITPVKRSHIAIGKILALSITSLVSSIANFIGLIASLPKLASGTDVSLVGYGLLEYLALFIIILSTVLIFVVIISIVSTMSSTVKEASLFSTPLMILITIIGLTSLMGGTNVKCYLHLIPIYNSVQLMTQILSLNFNLVNFIITIGSNLLFFSFGILIISKMFNNEKIMFNR